MAGPEHVISILLLWNIVHGSHGASLENRQYITRVDIPDAEDLSNERISVATVSKSWKEMPSENNKNYILDVDSVNPESRDEYASNAVSSFEQNSDSAPSSVSNTKEYTGDKPYDDETAEQQGLPTEFYYPNNLETEKRGGWIHHENLNSAKNRNLEHSHFNHLSYPLRPEAVYRTSKRSPRCLKKCLTQRLLHPAQCHSLC